MNLLSLQKAVYRRVKLADSPSSADVTRITEFLNQRYRKILAMPGMDQFRDTTLTFASVASQKKYGLPQALARIRDIYDLSNQRRVIKQTLDWVRQVDPGLTATSSIPEYWIPLNGWGAEAVELTSTGVGLWVVSDSASDTTQKAYVETTRLGGIRAGTAVSAGTTVNGLTRVAIGALTTHIEVVKFYLDVVGVGTISLYDAAAAGNLLASITPGRTNARYYMIQLYPTPSAAVTLSVDCQRAIQDLVNPTEEPLLHEDFQMAIVHGACEDEFRNRSDDRWKIEKIEKDEVLSHLRQYVLQNPDEIAVQRGPRGSDATPSRLGSNFPGGS